MSRGDTIWALCAQDFRRLEELLAAFISESNARCAVLLDRAGRLLSVAGHAADFDGVAFASLAAADFAASDQLAAQLGAKQFTSLYHQGENSSMYLVDVSALAILAALFDGGTTLGMVRLRTRDAVPGFSAVFADALERDSTDTAFLDSDWFDEAEIEIDRLFGR